MAIHLSLFSNHTPRNILSLLFQKTLFLLWRGNLLIILDNNNCVILMLVKHESLHHTFFLPYCHNECGPLVCIYYYMNACRVWCYAAKSMPRPNLWPPWFKLFPSIRVERVSFTPSLSWCVYPNPI